MRAQGLRHEEISRRIDSESAVIILRDFIDQRGQQPDRTEGSSPVIDAN
jgi:RNase H-fold protein (predicted Holliday junction resolvase)